MCVGAWWSSEWEGWPVLQAWGCVGLRDHHFCFWKGKRKIATHLDLPVFMVATFHAIIPVYYCWYNATLEAGDGPRPHGLRWRHCRQTQIFKWWSKILFNLTQVTFKQDCYSVLKSCFFFLDPDQSRIFLYLERIQSIFAGKVNGWTCSTKSARNSICPDTNRFLIVFTCELSKIK